MDPTVILLISTFLLGCSEFLAAYAEVGPNSLHEVLILFCKKLCEAVEIKQQTEL